MFAYRPLPKKHYEPPRLVIRQIAGKTMYWNYREQKWKKLTRRCPYLV